jgi:hypothetical protein
MRIYCWGGSLHGTRLGSKNTGCSKVLKTSGLGAVVSAAAAAAAAAADFVSLNVQSHCRGSYLSRKIHFLCQRTNTTQ